MTYFRVLSVTPGVRFRETDGDNCTVLNVKKRFFVGHLQKLYRFFATTSVLRWHFGTAVRVVRKLIFSTFNTRPENRVPVRLTVVERRVCETRFCTVLNERNKSYTVRARPGRLDGNGGSTRDCLFVGVQSIGKRLSRRDPLNSRAFAQSNVRTRSTRNLKLNYYQTDGFRASIML